MSEKRTYTEEEIRELAWNKVPTWFAILMIIFLLFSMSAFLLGIGIEGNIKHLESKQANTGQLLEEVGWEKVCVEWENKNYVLCEQTVDNLNWRWTYCNFEDVEVRHECTRWTWLPPKEAFKDVIK